MAKAFVRALPEGVLAPLMAVEPDGEIDLEWIGHHLHRLSVSIGHDNRLAYAWTDGMQSGRGVVNFDGVSIPVRLGTELSRFKDSGDAELRVA